MCPDQSNRAEVTAAAPGEEMEAPRDADIAYCAYCHERIYRLANDRANGWFGTWFHLETQRMACARSSDA